VPSIYDTLKPVIDTKAGQAPRTGLPVQNGGGIYPNAPGAPTTQGPPGVQAAQPGRPIGTQPPSIYAQLTPMVQGQATPQQGQQPLGQPAQPTQPGQPPLGGEQPQQPPAAPPPPAYGQYGEVAEGGVPGTTPGVNLTPEGKQKLAEQQMRALAKFGAYPGMNDPAAPKPQVIPGKPSFNPFTMKWA
jgi:hypothetical protein